MLVRDPAADGRFFTCVRTTGIFCRPVCPARPPHLKNCDFVATAVEAVAAGYRACKRCRPESAPGSPAWSGSAASVRRALALIERGGLDASLGNDSGGAAATVAALSDRLGLGERQVRRLFVKACRCTARRGGAGQAPCGSECADRRGRAAARRGCARGGVRQHPPLQRSLGRRSRRNPRRAPPPHHEGNRDAPDPRPLCCPARCRF